MNTRRLLMRWQASLTAAALMLGLAACGGGGGNTASPTAVARFTVGGTVTGLPSGTSITLQNNGGDSVTVTSNSTFTFPSAVAGGESFKVTIATPIPGATCAVNAGSGTVGSANVTTIGIACALTKYSIGGTVSGLTPGASVVLADNAGDPLTVSADGPFTFAAPITAGGTYAVTVSTQPAGQTCSVSAGTGTTTADVSTVRVACSAGTYTITATVTGLAEGGAIVLKNNDADPVHAAVNAKVTFPVGVSSGGHYSVTIETQPLYQTCSVVNGTGTVNQAPITDVVIHCPHVEVVWNFGAIGNGAESGVIQATDGSLYGTARSGGDGGGGAVYKYTSNGVAKYGNTGTTTALTSFTVGGSDGLDPEASVLQAADGNFYGTTVGGGTAGWGTVFKVTPTGTRTILWSFGVGTDGVAPKSALIQAPDGDLYGTTAFGGTLGKGTVFKITLAGQESVLWNFGSGSDGQWPETPLIQGADGAFYGITPAGGTGGNGVFFRLTSSGVETIVRNLDAVSGGGFASRISLDADGNFYGTGSSGGSHYGGTLFKITPAGNLSVLWNFGPSPAGGGPRGVVRGADGNFYGTTLFGGTFGAGTVFRITPDGVETALWSFGYQGNGTGAWSASDLIQAADGYFYGTMDVGNQGAGDGVLFRLIP